jgi:hypothetical protein
MGRSPLRVSGIVSASLWELSGASSAMDDIAAGCRSGPCGAIVKYQTACKPGSVPSQPDETGMAIPLGRPLPSASCDRPERRRGGSPVTPGTAGGCPPLLLGLAPGRVFLAAAVAAGAVRSYRTISPLPPARVAGTGRRCPFCGTFPGVAPAGGYPVPHLRGARTFLSPLDAESGHPAVWHRKIWLLAVSLSKGERNSL